MGWNLYTVFLLFWAFLCKIKIYSKLYTFGINNNKKSRNLAFPLLPRTAEWLAFPVVMKIMCENLLNFFREIPELLAELEGPSTVKRASHEVSKQGELFPKVNGKHHSAYQREENAVRVFAIILISLNCSQSINHTETFCCGGWQQKGLRNEYPGSLLTNSTSILKGSCPIPQHLRKWNALSLGTLSRQNPSTHKHLEISEKQVKAQPETKENATEHAV